MRQQQRPSLTVPGDLLKAVHALRHRLHREPEPSGHEEGTASRVREFLAETGLEPSATGVGGHGLLYTLEGGDGPTLLLRSDLDALPLTEDTGTPHASRRDGVHHACGHDGHAAMLAGALALLARQETEPPGTVHALFQPAEETGEGMAACLAHDALKGLEVDRCFAIHNIPGAPCGSVLVRQGTAAVASTGLRFSFEGATSHAGEPHRGRSPAGAVAALAQAIPAADHALPYDHPGLAVVVHMKVGEERYGTSPGQGVVAATVRADRDEDVEAMVERLRRTAEGLAGAGDLECTVERVEPFPATHNSDDAVDTVRQAAKAAGLTARAPDRPFPWSEDFGHATAKWPGALLGLGSGEECPDLHSPRYDFPDALLEPGIRFWTALATGGGQA